MRGWYLSVHKWSGKHNNTIALPVRLIAGPGKQVQLFLFSLFLVLALSTPASAKLNVVASIKPVHSLVAGVMSGTGSPHLLIESGSPHTYALKPSGAKALQNADIVVWIGPKLETFLTGPLKTLAGKALTVSLDQTKGLTQHAVRDDQKHSEKHGHGNEPQSIEPQSIEPQSIDPHIWLDPQNARALIIEIAKALAGKDPEQYDLYWSNARKMISHLEQLTQKIQTDLSPVKKRPYMTFHDGFQYFERRFNLNYAGSIASDPSHQPGARHLRELRRKLGNEGVKCIFTEPQFRSRLVEMMIDGTDVRTAPLDALGADIKKGPQLYFTLLENNARAFMSCLGGS